MSRTPERLGQALAAHAVGFQVGAAMIGAAVVPAGIGLIVGAFGLERMPIAAVMLAGLLWLLHEGLLRLDVHDFKVEA
jgi:hypothetical protein